MIGLEGIDTNKLAALTNIENQGNAPHDNLLESTQDDAQHDSGRVSYDAYTTRFKREFV